MSTILCADDFALTEGVSRGIGALAQAHRLSATSALVTTRHWPSHAGQLNALRPLIATGLHVNLTLGAPLGAMPVLCPAGRFPSIGAIVAMALRGRLNGAELTAEIGRQIAAFEQAVGAQPDFIDGHQHVHALPVVRAAFLSALRARSWASPPLVRVPADTVRKIRVRGAAVAKSLVLSALSFDFGADARVAGYPTNAGFSGVSRFDTTTPYAAELARFLSHPGPRHLVMCHPGHVDDELATLDPVVARRAQEFDALVSYPDLPARIWHPVRTAAGAIDWATAGSAHG